MADWQRRTRTTLAAGWLVTLLAAPAIAGAGPDAPQPEPEIGLWQRIRDGGSAILEDLKQRARPRDGGALERSEPLPAARARDEDVSRWSPPRISAPAISRLKVDAAGNAELAGVGTPGSLVVLKSSGRVVGEATVGADGRWQAPLKGRLRPGVHRLDAVVEAGNRASFVVGSDVRISLPEHHARDVVVVLNGNADPQRDLAERMSRDASDDFSKIIGGGKTRGTNVAGSKVAPRDMDQEPSGRASDTVSDGGPVIRWLERSAETYQDAVIQNLSQSPGGTGQPEHERPKDRTPETPPVPGVVAPSDDLTIGERVVDEALRVQERLNDWLARAKRTYQEDVADQLAKPREGDLASPPAEQRARVEEPAGPPSARSSENQDRDGARSSSGDDEAARRAASEARASEREREAAARAAAAEQAAQRQAAEREAARKAAEVRKAAEREAAAREAAASAEAIRQAEDQRRAAEAEASRRREAEVAARSEEARRLEETRKAEARRIAEEAERKEAERKRLADEAAKAAAARAAEEAEARRAAEALRREMERDAEDADAERLAADVERRQGPTEGATDDPPAPVAAEEPQAEPDDEDVRKVERARGEQPDDRDVARADASGTKRSGRRNKDNRPIEGSYEGDDNDAVEESAASTTPRAPCPKPPRARQVKGMLIHVVQPGDSLWSLAERYYGDGRRYRIIYRANRGRIHNPNRIIDCRHLYVPIRKR